MGKGPIGQKYTVGTLTLAMWTDTASAPDGCVSQPWHVLQAIGATTPFFTAFMSYFMLRSRETVIVYISLAPVVIGEFCHQLPLINLVPPAWAC